MRKRKRRMRKIDICSTVFTQFAKGKMPKYGYLARFVLANKQKGIEIPEILSRSIQHKKETPQTPPTPQTPRKRYAKRSTKKSTKKATTKARKDGVNKCTSWSILTYSLYEDQRVPFPAL